MWIPKTVEELEDRVTTGSLEESPTLDFKREVPGNNKEIAKDIAAMTTDGGVLIYGVGEDNLGRPRELTPIPLSGLPERIDQIARSGIHEPPTISVKTLFNKGDTGYLIVVVPQSPRAPHMVQLKSDHRFYGRGATGNQILTEGEVARLYRQREDWERDASKLLEDTIAEAPFQPHDANGLMFLMIAPVGGKNRLLRRSDEHTSPQDQREQLISLARHAHSKDGWKGPQIGYPEIRRHGQYWNIDLVNSGDQRAPENTYELRVFDDGRITLFFGHLTLNSQDVGLLLFIDYVAATTERFLRLANTIYQRAGFYGNVDTAVALTGIHGAIPNIYAMRDYSHMRQPYPDREYRSTRRFFSSEIAESSHKTAHDLLNNFFEALLGGQYPPLLEETS